MNYQETLDYIHSVCWKGSRPGLERITQLLSLIGNPEKELKVVHVAGTNGKGSFSAMLTSVLMSAGYRVGSFTSPFIEEFNERIQLSGENISDEDLSAVTSFIRPFADSMEDVPTEFELITAIGFEYFKRKNVDIVVLECGMGGRLDSTNVINEPLLSVITGISLDHTEYLGDTIEKIAAEKAGIIKKGCPVLFGGLDKAAETVIKERAEELCCCYSHTEHTELEIVRANTDGAEFNYRGYTALRIKLLGLYQPMNAANVVEAVGVLRTRGIAVSDEALYTGLYRAEWKGRFEKLCSDPLIFFDGGHNIEGATAAVETVKHYFPNKKINVLTGVMADKEYEEMARVIAKIANRVFTVAPDNPRALSAEELKEVFLKMYVPAESFLCYEDAVAEGVKFSRDEGVPLLALGSLYAYAGFKSALADALK